MKNTPQIHDGIAGGLISLGVLLGVYVSHQCLWLPGILGVTLLQNGFTGCCPVYFILDRTCPLEERTSLACRFRFGHMLSLREKWQVMPLS